MLFNLVDKFLPWLETHGLGFARVLLYPEFRAVASIILSFLFVMLLGRPVIRWLLRMKIGDRPEFYNKSLNELMQRKTNTPTMGGILIAGAILTSILLLADLTSFYVKMALLCLLWLAAVGLWDDWLKLTSARRKPGAREGLYSWEKLAFQLGLAVLLGLFIHHYGMSKAQTVDNPALQRLYNDLAAMSHCLNLPFLKTWTWNAGLKDFVVSPGIILLPTITFVALTTLVITGASNAVNLTDGMDGLAAGIMTIVAFAFMVLCLIAGYHHTGFGGVESETPFVLAKYLLVPFIPLSGELAIVAGAMVGSCLGFLWFNCSPAQVFMGDTGSLALGGLIGYIAVVVRQEFLLLIVGGVFVLEAVSVILQVGYFKLSKGQRIFRCAPIHHHFHLGGWTETQVVVRFWLMSIVLAAIALATVKLR